MVVRNKVHASSTRRSAGRCHGLYPFHDQCKPLWSTARIEQRDLRYVSTFLLDASIQNVYAVYKFIRTQSKTAIQLREFQRQVSKALVAPKLAQQATNIPI